MPQTMTNTDGGLLPGGIEDTWLWKLKLKLQFTGWLQYIPNALLVCLFSGLAGMGSLFGVLPWLLVGVPSTIASLLLLNLLVDLVTVKFGFRPTEAVPAPLEKQDAFSVMEARRSCRSYQSRDLTEEHREALLASVQKHSAPERLLADSGIRFEYINAPLTVWPVVGAREFFVAIAPKEYNRMAIVDVGRSLQKVVHEATRMGVGTCWIGPGADHKSIRKELGERFDPETEHIVCVCAIGYESRFKPLFIRIFGIKAGGTRRPLSSLFFAEPTFSEPLDPKKKPFDEYEACYKACRWAPSSYNSQTSRCAAVVEGEQLSRFDFAASTNSRWYAPVALGIWCANWEAGCEALGKQGEFRVLSEDERGVSNAPELPRYDISWIVSSSATQA